MSLHIKRLSAPRAWPITRKTGGHFVPKPTPGAHTLEAGLPLGLVLRDILGLVGTMGEASRVLAQKDVLVDGKVVTSPKRGVGLMDLIEVPDLGKNWRVLLDRHGRITLVPTDQKGWKLARIEDKTIVAGGKVQLNLHDGRNVVVKEDTYRTGDVLRLKLPDQKILGHHKLAEGSSAIIIGGKHAGQLVRVAAVEVTKNPKPNLVRVAAGDLSFSTIKPYIFVVGGEKPEITLPGVI